MDFQRTLPLQDLAPMASRFLSGIVILSFLSLAGCERERVSTVKTQPADRVLQRSDDPDFQRIRLGPAVLLVPKRYKAVVSETNLTIRTYWPGLPAREDFPVNRSGQELVYIHLKPIVGNSARLPVLDRIDQLLASGEILSPEFDKDLKLYTFRRVNGLGRYYRPSLSSDAAAKPLVFVCSADPRLGSDDQQCRGLVRITSSLSLEYRFTSFHLPNWQKLDSDIQGFVLSMIEVA